ncbi:hypothetical protein E2F46_00250 [Luteimonas aestuarii]|uniref:Uncharacterized protein n=1 Tax=Luteimonas aestuarii TaxID=453837 RepID=A0A4R5U3T1_9GAMM|nr:hypothetical protein [Luteimonas aestuarii]TDK28366.1 hypothetical protein E2F46_00250 [Luteimonas aestuarii]
MFAALRLLALTLVGLRVLRALHACGLVGIAALRGLPRTTRLVVTLAALFTAIAASTAILRECWRGGHQQAGKHQRRLHEAKSGEEKCHGRGPCCVRARVAGVRQVLHRVQ